MIPRSKAIACLLAIVAQMATPGLVLCQEIDGSIQIEFARDGCCNSNPVAGVAIRVEGPHAGGAGEAARTYAGPASSEAPDCVCEQDTSLDPLVTRPRPCLIGPADCSAGLPVEGHPGLLPHGVSALPATPHGFLPPLPSGVLAALRTIVLRN